MATGGSERDDSLDGQAERDGRMTAMDGQRAAGAGTGSAAAGERLTRERVLQAALRYVDGDGLAALSMHKLGAELGIKAMSLYYYVENKEDMLDGIVSLLWSEIDLDAIAQADWQHAARHLACSLRELVHRHPQAAPLLMSRRVATAPQLRVYAACLSVLEEAGFSRERAWELLRILVAYGFGYAQAEQTAFAPPPASERRGRPGSRRRMSAVPGDLPGELVEVARGACRGMDTTAEFEHGLDLMLRGLQTSP
jgi:AcrR family transcriptional regulator